MHIFKKSILQVEVLSSVTSSFIVIGKDGKEKKKGGGGVENRI